MESLIKNLKKHVESSICLDDFTKPKTIACPASQFLRECLKKHTLMSQRDGQLRCPNARHKWPSPKETDSISYRPDFFITAYSVFCQFNKVAIVVESAADFVTKTQSAETIFPIVSTAKSFLVVDCVNAHELFTDDAFAGHNLTPIRQF